VPFYHELCKEIISYIHCRVAVYPYSVYCLATKPLTRDTEHLSEGQSQQWRLDCSPDSHGQQASNLSKRIRGYELISSCWRALHSLKDRVTCHITHKDHGAGQHVKAIADPPSRNGSRVQPMAVQRHGSKELRMEASLGKQPNQSKGSSGGWVNANQSSSIYPIEA